MKRGIACALALILLAALSLGACTPEPTETDAQAGTETAQPQSPVSQNNPYSNPTYPIVNGEKKITYQADPYVVRDDDGTYYLYCTQTDVFAPEPRFCRGPVWRSDDLHSWEFVGDVFAGYTPDWGTAGAGVWAPSVVKVGDHWNFYYSLSTGSDPNPGIGVATAPTPYGPWTHYGKLFNSEEIGVTNSIDPHVLWDDGKLYMVFGSYGGLITLIELTEDGLSLAGGLEYQREHKIALGGYETFELNNYEASFLLRHDGYYYLLLSTGSTLSGLNSTYHVVVARSEHLTGPYLDADGRDLFGPNRGEAVVVPSKSGAMGTGHCAVITDDAGEYWLLYHGYDTTASGEARVLYLDRLIWDEETGFPHVENTKASNGVELPGPYIEKLEEGGQ